MKTTTLQRLTTESQAYLAISKRPVVKHKVVLLDIRHLMAPISIPYVSLSFITSIDNQRTPKASALLVNYMLGLTTPDVNITLYLTVCLGQ